MKKITFYFMMLIGITAFSQVEIVENFDTTPNNQVPAGWTYTNNFRASTNFACGGSGSSANVGLTAGNTGTLTTPNYTTIDKKYFEPVIEGLFNVVDNPRGTAHWSKVEGIDICGKTGTAENPHGQDHSIFIAFAPKDNPKIAIAVFVENGYWGSRWAGPIATLMIENYLKGKTNRPLVEERMFNGSIQEEYNKQIQGNLRH